MNAKLEQALTAKIRHLTPEQMAEVERFVDFLAAKLRKRFALEQLLSVAPVLEAAGVEPLSEEEMAAEVKAACAERRARPAEAFQRIAQLPTPPA